MILVCLHVDSFGDVWERDSSVGMFLGSVEGEGVVTFSGATHLSSLADSDADFC